MKKCISDNDFLTVDVCDFMFVEWLSRHDLYSRFVANLSAVRYGSASPRAAVRDVVAFLIAHPRLTLANAVSSSFVFQSTPEGDAFWSKVSRDWASFLGSFSFVI